MSTPYDVLRRDPVMDALIAEFGQIGLDPADNEFERLCTSIINQQLSTASAAAVRERVVDTLDGTVTPSTVLAASPVALRNAGLSRTKVEYMKNAAEAFQDRDLTRSGLADEPNDAVIDELTQIKGVGEWTAHMYLMFVLGREDIFPIGDLGIRNGIQQLYGDGAELSRDEMIEIAAKWRPYRSYGTRYIWRAYEA